MVRKCDHTHTYNRRNLLHLSPCGWAGCSKEPPSHFLRHQDTQIVSHVSNVSSKRREHYSHCRAKWVCSISPWSCYLVASTWIARTSFCAAFTLHIWYLQNSTWDLRIQPEMTSLTKRSTRKLKKNDLWQDSTNVTISSQCQPRRASILSALNYNCWWPLATTAGLA